TAGAVESNEYAVGSHGLKLRNDACTHIYADGVDTLVFEGGENGVAADQGDFPLRRSAAKEHRHFAEVRRRKCVCCIHCVDHLPQCPLRQHFHQLADTASPLGNNNVATSDKVANDIGNFLDSLCIDRIDPPALANAAAQLLAGCPRYFLFSRCVNFVDNQQITAAEHLDKVLVQIPGAAVPVGLKGQQQATARPAIANRAYSGRHLNRVVAVIVHQHGGTALYGILAVNLKAPTHTLKTFKAAQNRGIGYFFVRGHSNGGSGVEDIVNSGNIQLHRQ